jgi:hypothetical protein
MILRAQRASGSLLCAQSLLKHIFETICRTKLCPPIPTTCSNRSVSHISTFCRCRVRYEALYTVQATVQELHKRRGQGHTCQHPYKRGRAAIIHMNVGKGSAYLPHADIAAWCAHRRFLLPLSLPRLSLVGVHM